MRAVALGKLQAAFTPAVAALTHKLAFGFTADVIQSRLDEEALQVPGQDDLQSYWEYKLLLERHHALKVQLFHK